MKEAQMDKCLNMLTRSLVSAIMLTFGTTSEASDEMVMKILRPKPAGEQISPSYVELNYVLLDVRHPNGIEWVKAVKTKSKKGGPNVERTFYEKDRHPSGYFFFKRRFKSPEIRDYFLVVKPVGANCITSVVQSIEYRDEIPDYLGFVNLGDGDVVEANDPLDTNDVTYIYLDCMDSCGIRGDGNFSAAKHVGYKDEDGIDWIELVINGPGGKTVVTNSTALIFDADQKYHGPYWGDPVDPERTKRPAESWPEGVAWKPIEGFGLYEFALALEPGSYTLGIRAKNNYDEIIEGPSITITASAGGASDAEIG